jgi:hypothetical protein
VEEANSEALQVFKTIADHLPEYLPGLPKCLLMIPSMVSRPAMAWWARAPQSIRSRLFQEHRAELEDMGFDFGAREQAMGGN